MGDACRTCDGIGTVRQRGRAGWERIPCPDCGGCGHRHAKAPASDRSS